MLGEIGCGDGSVYSWLMYRCVGLDAYSGKEETVWIGQNTYCADHPYKKDIVSE